MKLSWRRHVVQLRHPWSIASHPAEALPRKEKLIVRIDHDGRAGWGEASPVSYYDQSNDSAEEAMRVAAEMLGSDPFALEAILTSLLARLPDQPAAVAAVDIALHDLVGKLLDVPLWKMLGLDPHACPPSSFSIGIDTPEIVESKVREAQGSPILKIKIGTADDASLLEAVRRAAPDVPLRVDVNGAWAPDQAAARLSSLERYRIELLEQPLAREHDAEVARLREAASMPIYADESCLGLKDVLRCAGYYDGINIKLCKCGGLRPALRMIHTARAAGLKVMLGCMIETSVGIAAAAQLAPLADAIDLDGHLLLKDDPFTGIGGEGGRLTLTERPGLGIEPVDVDDE